MLHTIEAFFKKVVKLQEQNSPFVIYRKPNSSLVNLWFQKSDELHFLSNFKSNGFVFSPFDSKESTIIFPLDESTQFSCVLERNSAIDLSNVSTSFKDLGPSYNEKEHHINLVEKAILFIEQHQAEKIVLSRKETIFVDGLNPIKNYKKMLKLYPNAFVYFWNHPSIGSWMGASPEQLVNLKQGIFRTMSLAGTQPYINNLDVVWETKEKEEQQIVTDYILEVINEPLEEIETSKPYTVKAGSLLHLRTDISGVLKNSESLEQLINSLHPTPAVCGFPKEIATKFIVSNEGYNRNYYAGYLGELNINESTNLFVNLRCMEIESDKVNIYIGGGITKESNSENEWLETVAKSAVMKKIL